MEQGHLVDQANLAGRLSHVEQNQTRIINLLDRLEEKIEKASKLNIPALGLGWSVLFGLVMLLGTMAIYNVNSNMQFLGERDKAIAQNLETRETKEQADARWEFNTREHMRSNNEKARIESDLNDRITRFEADVQRLEDRLFQTIKEGDAKTRADLDKSDSWIIEQMNLLRKNGSKAL